MSMYVCKYVCTDVFLYVCMYMYVCTYKLTCMYVGNPSNGGVPQLGNLTAHLEYITQHLPLWIPDEKWTGHAVFDFENWTPIFEENDSGMHIYMYIVIHIHTYTHAYNHISTCRRTYTRTYIR